MTAISMPLAVRMRPIISADDALAAGEILALFIGNEPWKLDDVAPEAVTFNPVELAVDGSAAIFEAYLESGWSPGDPGTLVARIIVRR